MGKWKKQVFLSPSEQPFWLNPFCPLPLPIRDPTLEKELALPSSFASLVFKTETIKFLGQINFS